MIKRYIYNILISLDQFGNVLADGDPDETISSRVGKNPKVSFLSKGLHKLLNWLEPEHCEKSIEIDEGKDNVF